MSGSSKAVFLSYASQDAEAAKRICDALRAAGVEVWFDQSELVGGDAWDQKIRRQIKDCALLIPIISAATQARTEGYFRLEWRLADQRTHLMAKGRAFLLPVVIDDTRDFDAHVPDSFTEVQWTRLKDGATPPAFCERVKRLLDGDVGRDLRIPPSDPTKAGFGDPALHKKGRPWLIPMILGAVAIAVATVWFTRKPGPAAAVEPPARRSAPTTTETVVAPLTEAQKLVARARKIYDDGDELNRDNLFLADEMVQRALALDPSEPSAWELATWFSYIMVWHAIDVTQARRETLLRQANRAIALAPDSVAAQLVYANAQLAGRFGGGNASPGNFAPIEASLKQLAGREPQNWKIQRALGTVYRLTQRMDEAVRVFNRAIELSDGDPMATADLVNVLIRRNHFAEAEALLARELAHHRSSRLLTFNLIVKYRWRGDAESAAKDIADWPDWLLQQDRGFSVAWQAALWARQPDLALRLVLQFPRQEVRDIIFSGPKAVLSARAQELAGNIVAAQADWRAVLQQCDQELAANASDLTALYWKAWALARLGDQTGAQAAATLLRQRLQSVPSNYIHSYTAAALWVTVGWTDVAVTTLQAELQTPTDYISLTRAGLELEPAFDPIRSDPRFQDLVRLAPSPSPASGLQARPELAERAPSARPEVEPKSVAVLAFANLSDDKANEYFSDGISEELLNVLAKVPQLKVAARTSSFYFKGRNEPIPEIARKLGVAYVVEGSVRKAGNKVRVTAQLIKAADGFHVWSETYDRDLTDIFAVQDEIAKKILGVVKGSVLGETELPHATTTKIEAYTLFLQAQGAFALRGEANLREAVRLFEAALAVDPDYVPALVGLAKALVVLPNYAYLTGPKAREVTEAANKAARRALELEPQNAAAHASVGWATFQYGWQWSEGLAEVERARDLAPNDSWNWNLLGDCHRLAGDHVQALVDKQRAWELDPLSPNSHWDLAYTYLVVGRYDEAIQWSEKCIALAPHNMDSYTPGLLAAGRAGRLDQMRRMLTATRQNVHEGEGLLLLLEAYGAILEKKPVEARRLLALAAPLAESGTGSLAYLGYIFLLLGESDQAAQWLQRAYERRDLSMIWSEIIDFDVIAANPKTRPILDQPGLKELYELRHRNARAGLNKL